MLRYADVYADGATERYRPTWGCEPTRGLYHPLPLDMEGERPPPTDPLSHADGGVGKPVEDALCGRYCWHGEDYDSGADDVDPFTGEQVGSRLIWRCELALGTQPAAEAPDCAPPSTSRPADELTNRPVKELTNRPVDEGGTRRRAPFAPASLRYEYVRTTLSADGGTGEAGGEGNADGTASVAGQVVEVVTGNLRGVWRRAPGNANQIHLFEWQLAPTEQTPGVRPAAWLDVPHGLEPRPLPCVEAPSVLCVLHERTPKRPAVLVEGWEGGPSPFGLAERMARARTGRQTRQPGGGVEPIVFLPATNSADSVPPGG